MGIERDPGAARAAAGRLDRVLVGDVEGPEPDLAPGSFDAVLCGGLLGHLREPLRLLRRARGWLRPDGRLVASLANVRHHGVVRALLEGHWTDEPAGPPGRSHLRFFTRREVEKLFHRAGFGIARLQAVFDPGHEPRPRSGPPVALELGGLRVGGLSAEEADEFSVVRFLVEAEPRPRPDYGLTSVVIVPRGRYEALPSCLSAIHHRTDEPVELIVVDDRPRGGAPLDLAGWGRGEVVRVVVAADARGLTAAANRGIRAAAGAQVLLLEAGCLVTTGWLGRMLRALHGDPRIAAVGPRAPGALGAQRAGVDPGTLTSWDGFAWDWGLAHDGEVAEAGRLGAFCLLVRREALDAAGLPAEGPIPGGYEGAGFFEGLRRAGRRVVVAGDALVFPWPAPPRPSGGPPPGT